VPRKMQTRDAPDGSPLLYTTTARQAVSTFLDREKFVPKNKHRVLHKRNVPNV
ncbi:hypothetical protein J6590_045591, partial [Homalodisca vitripennis]